MLILPHGGSRVPPDVARVHLSDFDKAYNLRSRKLDKIGRKGDETEISSGVGPYCCCYRRRKIR